MSHRFPIHIFEEHSSTLPVWWQSRKPPCTAVYLDAHLDLQKIPAGKIEALQQCQNLKQIEALEAPHHLNLSEKYAFGIENFLYAASELKLIKQLIWVVPPHIPKTYSSSLLGFVQQMEGVSFAELCSFKSVGNHALRGTLLGLDITLCSFEDLHSLKIEAPWYLDIDIDYFVRVPDDQLWIDPDTVLTSILEQLGKPEIATISRAVDSGFTPLSMRYIADYAAAILQQDQKSSSHYQQLTQALNHLSRSQTALALDIFRKAVKSKADCAASHYLMSIALDIEKQAPKQVQTARTKAIALDNHYAFDLSRVASGFPNRHRPCSAAQLDALSKQLSTIGASNTDKPTPMSEIAIGLLYATHGELNMAWQLLQKQRGDFSGHSELLMAIVHGILESSEPQKAKALLEQAIKSSKTRSNAHLSLADLALSAGDTQTALHHYEKVSHYSPAWLRPLEQQALCLEKLDETALHKKLSQAIEQRKLQLTHLIQE